MSPQNVVMARPKKKPTAADKRKYIEVRPAFIPGLLEVAAQLGADDTEALNTLVREGLEKRGLWPPRKSADAE